MILRVREGGEGRMMGLLSLGEVDRDVGEACLACEPGRMAGGGRGRSVSVLVGEGQARSRGDMSMEDAGVG